MFNEYFLLTISSTSANTYIILYSRTKYDKSSQNIYIYVS